MIIELIQMTCMAFMIYCFIKLHMYHHELMVTVKHQWAENCKLEQEIRDLKTRLPGTMWMNTQTGETFARTIKKDEYKKGNNGK